MQHRSFPLRFAFAVSARLCGALACIACGGGGPEPLPTSAPDKVVACPCDPAGTLSGSVAGRDFSGVVTGVLEPSIGDLEITLHEGGEPPTCYESGKVEVRGGTGTRVVLRFCIPPMGSRDVGNNGGPVGTHCTDRMDSAAVLIADETGDTGELMQSGTLDISMADGQCVSGSVDASHITIQGGAQTTETLRGTFTVPNASCWSAWTDNVTKYCP